MVERAKKLLELIDENVHLVQRISSELRPGLLDNLGLSAAIEWQAAQLRDRTGVKCDLISEPEDIVLDQTRSTALFRIFQETCTNIARREGYPHADTEPRSEQDERIQTFKESG